MADCLTVASRASAILCSDVSLEHACRGRPSLLPSITKDELDMYDRSLLCLLTLAAALCLPPGAFAQDAAKYPDWSGHWRSGPPNRWDPTKPGGLAQQAPLTAEY